MTLQQMEIFIAVAKYGSFTAAAKKFYTTQPTISRQVSLLEDELGYALLDRQEKPLRLTTAGNTIYQQYTSIVEQIKQAGIMGKMIAEGQSGHLAIAFAEGLYIEEYFSVLLENLKESFEGLKLSFTKIPMGDMQEYLLAREGDIVVSLHLPVLDCDQIGLEELFPIESFILMSKMHPLAGKESLGKEDLLNENVYLSEPLKCYSIIDSEFGGFLLNKDKIISLPSIDTALLNIRFAGGVTSANNMMHASFDDTKFKKFPLLDDSRVPKVAMAWNRESNNPAIPFFRDLVKAYFLNK